MSGGSFNYLCWRDKERIFEDDELERMYEWLKEQGFLTAAERTNEIIQAGARIQELIENLRKVWQAAEWCCSSDWSLEDTTEVIGIEELQL